MKRLIATLIIKDGLVVQSVGFKKYLPIGKPEIAVEFLNNWGIDEIIILDINATINERLINLEMVRRASKKCFVPLTIGGGISSIEHAKELLQAGADKICLNHSARNNPNLITELATKYGNQFVVVSVDIMKEEEEYKLYDYITQNFSDLDLFNYIKEVVGKGAGELFINTVNRDGMYQGYDTVLAQKVCDLVDLPVIFSGGAGNADHIVELLSSTSVSAGSASNYFNFYEHSVTVAKAALVQNGVQIRNETFADYNEHHLDGNTRLLKKSDKELEGMRFIIIEREII